MKLQKKKGLPRLLSAVRNSLAGLVFAFRSEEAFRQEVYLTVVLIPVALLIDTTLSNKAIMILCLFVVLITELLNSAVEIAVDRIGYEYHELSKIAKDIASAAVMLSLVMTVVVWLVILLG